MSTGCEKCDAEQAKKKDRSALCEQHQLEELSETARITESEFQFAVLKKLIELDVRIKELGN